MLQVASEEHKTALAAREQQVRSKPLSQSSAFTSFPSRSDIDLMYDVMARIGRALIEVTA